MGELAARLSIWKTRESATVIHMRPSNLWNQGVAIQNYERQKGCSQRVIANVVSNIAGRSQVINLRVTTWNVTCIMLLR